MPRKISKHLENITEWSCIKTNCHHLWLSCQITELDEGYTANNVMLIRLFFARNGNSFALVYWWISFVMPIKCNISTSSFFSVCVKVDILGLKRSTYALENGSSTIAANLWCANFAMWECCYCHWIYYCFFHSYCHCHCQLILLFLLLHQLLLIQLFTLLLYIIATYTGADVTIAIY